MPHLAASGCVQATMPFGLCTTLRLLGHFMYSLDAAGNSEEVGRGMLDSVVWVGVVLTAQRENDSQKGLRVYLLGGSYGGIIRKDKRQIERTSVCSYRDAASRSWILS